MKIRAASLAIPALALYALQDSPQERVFHFAHPATADAMQQVATAIRTIGDIQQIFVDTGARNLTVNGTPPQLSLSDWLFQNLDASVSSQGPAVSEYQIAGDPNPAAAVLHIVHSDTPAVLQELLNTIRTIGDIKRAFPYLPGNAIAVRGTTDQIALTKWLVRAADQPRGLQPAALSSTSPEYDLAADRDPVARVLYLQHTATPQGMQEIVNALRAIAAINRVFPLNAPEAIAVRGTADQVALGEWLLRELDRAPTTTLAESADTAASSYRNENEARVFHLAHIQTPQAMQQTVNAIRAATLILWVMPVQAPRALAMRGTASQVAQAEKLIAELDQ